jgi:hypothetical protein
VYVFLGDNAGGTASAVVQLSISTGNIVSGGTGAAVTVGTNSATTPLYAGVFDNTYYSSASGNAGNLYVCGNAGGSPTLYQIPITSGGGMGTVATGPLLANNTGTACSPLAEIYNTSTDWLFLSVGDHSCGASATTAGGCIMSFNVTSGAPTIGPWTPSTAYASGAEVVDTAGNIQKCNTNCGVAGVTSGTTTPAWTTSTTTDGNGTSASAVGTVSSTTGLSATGTYSVTIGTLAVSSSPPGAAGGTLSDTKKQTTGYFTITQGSTTWTYNIVTTLSTGSTYTVNVERDTGDPTVTTQNLYAAILADSTKCGDAAPCFDNGSGAANSAVTATYSSGVTTLTAKTPGTGANSIALYASASTFNACGVASTTEYMGTSPCTPAGSDGTTSFSGKTFAFWSGSAPATADALASNLYTALNGGTIATSTTVTVTNPGGTSSTFTGTDNTPGTTGNSIGVSAVLPGFAWTYNSISTTTLQGGLAPFVWTYQSASNGQTTAAQATGTSGIVIDNVSNTCTGAPNSSCNAGATGGTGASSIYFGTLSGTGATNSAVKMTQAGLK